MIDILRDYLVGAASPEFVQSIEDAHAIIDTFDLPDIADGFEEILMVNESIDQGEAVQRIYDQTREIQVALLAALGVTPADDTRVDRLTVLLSGLQAIEHYNDPDMLIQHCGLEMHSEELLAEVLSLTTNLTAEELLVDIHDVSDRTIKKIVEVAAETLNAQETPDHALAREKYIHAYRNIKTVTGGTDLTMDHYLASGIDAGYPFLIYANLIGRDFENMPVINIAANLVSMALLSTDGCENPRATIAAHIEDFINDLDLLTKVDIAVGDLLLKWQILQTTGIKHG